MEPLLAKKISKKKDRTMTPERILKILADVTEQPIERPKDRKKRGFYLAESEGFG